MTAEERNKVIKKMMANDLELLIKKGHDYSGDEDCMANLREFGFAGVIVRIGDKYYRTKNFVKSGLLHVPDETVEDTLVDLSNYCYLARILFKESKKHKIIRLI